MSENIYFSKIEFREYVAYQLHSILLINLVEGTLAYQVYEPIKIRKGPAITGITTEEFMVHTWNYELRKPAVKMKNSKTGFKPVIIEDIIDKYDVAFSYSYHFTKEELKILKSYCMVADFEIYRNREMSMEDPGYCGYRDEVNVYFTGVTDSYVPIMKLPMSYYYDEEHIWPSEKLYKYIIKHYMSGKKLSKWVMPYGALSLLW